MLHNFGFVSRHDRTGKSCTASTPGPVVPYKALGNFPKALYGTTGHTCTECTIFSCCHVSSRLTELKFPV